MVLVSHKWEFLCKMTVCDLSTYSKHNNYTVSNWEKKKIYKFCFKLDPQLNNWQNMCSSLELNVTNNRFCFIKGF